MINVGHMRGMMPMEIATRLWTWWKKGVVYEDIYMTDEEMRTTPIIELEKTTSQQLIGVLTDTHTISDLFEWGFSPYNETVFLSYWYKDKAETVELLKWMESINHYLYTFGCPWKLYFLEEREESIKYDISNQRTGKVNIIQFDMY